MDFGKAVSMENKAGRMGNAVDCRRGVKVPADVVVPRDFVLPKLHMYNAVELRKAIEMCPAIKYIDDSALEAIIAAIISGAALAGGIALTIVTAGAAVPSIALALIASTATTAGMVGVTYAASHMNGSFLWSEWAKQSGVASGITVLTFGAGFAAGGAVTSLCVRHACHLSQATVEFLAGSAGALAGAATQGSAHCLFKIAEGGEIEGFELVVECAAGAMAGAAAGKLACKTQLAKLYRGDRIVSSNRPAGPGDHPECGKQGKGFHTKPQAVGSKHSKVKIFTSNAPVRYDDLPVLNNTGALASTAERGSSVLIITGTHGNELGQTLLDNGGKAGAEELARFVQQDLSLLRQSVFDNLRKAGRSVQLVDLREFAGEPVQFVRHLRGMQPRPTCIVANFCYSDMAMDPRVDAEFGKCIRAAFMP